MLPQSSRLFRPVMKLAGNGNPLLSPWRGNPRSAFAQAARFAAGAGGPQIIRPELIRPRSILVVGGSERKETPGGRILHNIIVGGFDVDKLFVVNPKALQDGKTEIQGARCINLEKKEHQFDIDLAFLLVPPKLAKGYVEKMIDLCNIKSIIIPSAGFSEAGPEGKQIEDEILEMVNRHNVSLIGPNCVGIATPYYDGVFVGGPSRRAGIEGFDIVSASGSVAVFIAEHASSMGLRVASMFSIGNSAQIGIEEVVQYWDEAFDPATCPKSKIIYVESVKKPKLLLKHAASLIEKGCNIAALKSGVSEVGAHATSSHTGALATRNEAVDALFKRAGIVSCDTRAELTMAAAIFAHKELKGSRLAVITDAGGPGIIAVDRFTAPVTFPTFEGEDADQLKAKLNSGASVRNPIDVLPTVTTPQLGLAIDFAEKRENIDGIVLIHGDPGLKDITEDYELILKKTRECSKPIYVIFPSIVTGHEQLEDYKSRGGICFAYEGVFGRTLMKIIQTPRPTYNHNIKLPEIDTAAIRKIVDSSPGGYLSLLELQALLDAAGIPRAQARFSNNIAEVRTLVKELGFPIVMKVSGILHKTDVGGIRLNINDLGTAFDAFDSIMSIEGADGVIVQHMALSDPRAHELFLGAKQEGEFGSVILFGMGGTYVEVFKDVVETLSPVDHQTAIEMIRSLKGYPLIQGVRGKLGVNEHKIAEVITRLSALMEVAPEIKELDFNPLMGLEDEVAVVDMRIRLEHEPRLENNSISNPGIRSAL